LSPRCRTASLFLAKASFATGQLRDSAILGVLVSSLSAAVTAALHFRGLVKLPV
jgi:hypothetical protein